MNWASDHFDAGYKTGFDTGWYLGAMTALLTVLALIRYHRDKREA